MKYIEFDDVKNEKYEIYECDWSGEVVDYDELYDYGKDEVSIQALTKFFYEEGEKRGSELCYDPNMQMFMEEDQVEDHVYKFYEKSYQ